MKKINLCLYLYYMILFLCGFVAYSMAGVIEAVTTVYFVVAFTICIAMIIMIKKVQR